MARAQTSTAGRPGNLRRRGWADGGMRFMEGMEMAKSSRAGPGTPGTRPATRRMDTATIGHRMSVMRLEEHEGVRG